MAKCCGGWTRIWKEVMENQFLSQQQIPRNYPEKWKSFSKMPALLKSFIYSIKN
jgi:hypothetical protein